MSRIFDEAMALERREDGRYVREIDAGPFWGIVTPHGGYLMALVLEAMTREMSDPARRPRMLSQHFLGAIRPGPIEFAVEVERVGRGVTSVSARISTSISSETEGGSTSPSGADGGLRAGATGSLVGLATALFSVDGEGPTFLDDPIPEVAPPLEPDREMGGFFVARVHHQFEFHRRFGEDGAVVPCEDGGWIVAKESGIWDHRFALIASDLWVPPIIRHPDRVAATPSLHHVVHFGPDVGGDDAMPLLVRHRMSSGGQGLTDEDIRLWAADGRLLISAKQLRTTVPLHKVMGRDFDRDVPERVDESYVQIPTDHD